MTIKKTMCVAAITALTLQGSVVGYAQADTSNNTLTVAINGDIQNFNPYTDQSVDYFIIRYNVFDSLVRFNTSMRIVPDLATQWHQTSATQWVFKLRNRVKFHDGHVLSPVDVQYSIQTVQNPKSASFFAPYFSNVKSIESRGSNVIINLRRPDPAFLSDLASFPIIERGTFSKLTKTPIGTGPFKFVSWSPGDKTVLTKFNNYWGGSTTNVENVILRPITDASVRMSNLYSGTVDMVDSLDPNQMREVVGRGGYTLLMPKSSNTTVLAEVVQKNNKAFQDPRVMHALIYALDKQTILKNVYQGYGKILWSPFPSDNFGYKQEPRYSFNLEKAKQLLQEAGYSKGLSFTLILPDGFPDLEQIAVIWQSDLQKIGVNMTINKMELNSWVSTYVARSYQITLNIYPEAGNDPSVYCNQILLPLVKKSLLNPSRFETLIARGSTTSNVFERLKIYGTIQDLVSQQVPLIPIQEIPVAAAASQRVTGEQIFPTGAIYLGNVKMQ